VWRKAHHRDTESYYWILSRATLPYVPLQNQFLKDSFKKLYYPPIYASQVVTLLWGLIWTALSQRHLRKPRRTPFIVVCNRTEMRTWCLPHTAVELHCYIHLIQNSLVTSFFQSTFCIRASFMRATWLANLIFLDLIAQTVLGEEYETRTNQNDRSI
jgi:hypothetical protein